MASNDFPARDAWTRFMAAAVQGPALHCQQAAGGGIAHNAGCIADDALEEWRKRWEPRQEPPVMPQDRRSYAENARTPDSTTHETAFNLDQPDAPQAQRRSRRRTESSSSCIFC